ncbi:hypothetical protein LY76DRAFT_194563 [Colletotrichum caudatum]|nr:hypothetical protein LY76DRAFT_194563 [Colletotrichum caudatum]
MKQGVRSNPTKTGGGEVRDALAEVCPAGNPPRTKKEWGGHTSNSHGAHAHTHTSPSVHTAHTRLLASHGPVPRTWPDATDMRRRTRIATTTRGLGDTEPSLVDICFPATRRIRNHSHGTFFFFFICFDTTCIAMD